MSRGMSRGWSDASSAGSGFLSIDGEAMDKKEQSSALRAALEQHSALYQRSIDAVQHGPNIVREIHAPLGDLLAVHNVDSIILGVTSQGCVVAWDKDYNMLDFTDLMKESLLAPARPNAKAKKGKNRTGGGKMTLDAALKSAQHDRLKREREESRELGASLTDAKSKGTNGLVEADEEGGEEDEDEDEDDDDDDLSLDEEEDDEDDLASLHGGGGMRTQASVAGSRSAWDASNRRPGRGGSEHDFKVKMGMGVSDMEPKTVTLTNAVFCRSQGSHASLFVTTSEGEGAVILIRVDMNAFHAAQSALADANGNDPLGFRAPNDEGDIGAGGSGADRDDDSDMNLDGDGFNSEEGSRAPSRTHAAHNQPSKIGRGGADGPDPAGDDSFQALHTLARERRMRASMASSSASGGSGAGSQRHSIINARGSVVNNNGSNGNAGGTSSASAPGLVTLFAAVSVVSRHTRMSKPSSSEEHPSRCISVPVANWVVLTEGTRISAYSADQLRPVWKTDVLGSIVDANAERLQDPTMIRNHRVTALAALVKNVMFFVGTASGCLLRLDIRRIGREGWASRTTQIVVNPMVVRQFTHTILKQDLTYSELMTLRANSLTGLPFMATSNNNATNPHQQSSSSGVFGGYSSHSKPSLYGSTAGTSISDSPYSTLLGGLGSAGAAGLGSDSSAHRRAGNLNARARASPSGAGISSSGSSGGFSTMGMGDLGNGFDDDLGSSTSPVPTTALSNGGSAPSSSSSATGGTGAALSLLTGLEPASNNVGDASSSSTTGSSSSSSSSSSSGAFARDDGRGIGGQGTMFFTTPWHQNPSAMVVPTMQQALQAVADAANAQSASSSFLSTVSNVSSSGAGRGTGASSSSATSFAAHALTSASSVSKGPKGVDKELVEVIQAHAWAVRGPVTITSMDVTTTVTVSGQQEVYLAVGCADGTIHVFNALTLHETALIMDPVRRGLMWLMSPVLSVVCTPNMSHVISLDTMGTLRVWSVNDATLVSISKLSNCATVSSLVPYSSVDAATVGVVSATSQHRGSFATIGNPSGNSYHHRGSSIGTSSSSSSSSAASSSTLGALSDLYDTGDSGRGMYRLLMIGKSFWTVLDADIRTGLSSTLIPENTGIKTPPSTAAAASAATSSSSSSSASGSATSSPSRQRRTLNVPTSFIGRGAGFT